jgi:hypothetical protein
MIGFIGHLYTARDYTLQITITHRPVFSVALLPTADVPLLLSDFVRFNGLVHLVIIQFFIYFYVLT